MRVAFFGTPEFAVPTLEAILESSHDVVLVVAQPDRPSGRGMKLHKPPVAQLAQDRSLALVQPERLGDDLMQMMRDLEVEICVVVAYGRILPKRLIDSVPHGFINVHASLLPRWRGAAPIQRAIEAGDRETGVTIMRIDEKLDHGPTFASQSVPIGEHDRAPELFGRLAREGGPLLVEVLDAIEAGTSHEVEQDHSQATHAAKLGKHEARIDWTLPARVLYDRYRAFHPWPGVHFEIAAETIRASTITGVGAESGAPGVIISMSDVLVVVGTGEGSLHITAMQRPGRRAADAAEVLRGLRIGTGDVLE